MILPLLHMGDPRLHMQADKVCVFNTNELHTLAADMRDTMEEAGGVGLAAPQVGVLLRVIAFGFEAGARDPDMPSIPWTVLINPQLELISHELDEDWEGCLSVPGLRAQVPRYRRLSYSAFDLYGEPINGIAEGFHARVIQHEVDHLDGILYPARIADFSKFGFVNTPEQM